MGVPSYFAYIIRNHPNIIQKLFMGVQLSQTFERLYMDCNSILYDSYYEIKKPESYSDVELYDLILAKTTSKIEGYIYQIRPRDTLFIAFDGVAPFAKMEQQRNRRYKSWYQTFMKHPTSLNTEEPDIDIHPIPIEEKRTTSMFTPGTVFMQRLSEHMKTAFLQQEKKYKLRNIILATPQEPGEGEHKLYEHLRKFPIKDKNVAIYGLDADLIMLSLFHLPFSQNIFVFREAPEFMKSALGPGQVPGQDSTKELWGLNILKLGHSISNEMACSYPDNHRMYDYVFLCFFLGNDFLPHFPALNIRTQGIQRLMDTYRMCIGNKPNSFLISPTNFQIQWREVNTFIYFLAKNERNFIKQEYAIRKKWDYLQSKYETLSEHPEKLKKIDEKEWEEMIQNVPVIFRQEEEYICPYESGWENRYYERLLETKEIKERKEIAINYLEGLEWVFQYYTSGCIHWKWKYRYNYPPLLSDILPYIPKHNYYDFFYRKHNYHSYSPQVQMAYVLPRSQLHLLPEKYRTFLLEKHTEWYPIAFDREKRTGPKYQWAFCRYLWESHVLLPEISIDILEKEFAILK